MKRKFYLTTAIPYVNAAPHLGFSLEIIQADVISRYQRLINDDVFFLTGTDENSLKNVQAAKEEGIAVQALCDKYAARYRDLKKALNLSFDDFIRTSDQKRHWPGAQKLWQACDRAGDIYQKDYQGQYCVGCEEFKTEKELVNGRCPEHPQKKLERIKEKNYFFRLSRYQKQLEKLITSEELKVVPLARKNEVLSFIHQGLEDFSISRSVKRAKNWGIPVPGDPTQIIYVWFDALSNYITALGYGGEEKRFKRYWPADVQVIGKGIIRFHAVYWPAMLLSTGLALPKSIFVHGYLTIEGQKISKSLGNTINPFALVKKYGADAVRYYLLAKISPYTDGDFSLAHFEESYNADLANGLGNLTARIAKLCDRPKLNFEPSSRRSFSPKYKKKMAVFRFDEALKITWQEIQILDRYLDQRKPWQINDRQQLNQVLSRLVKGIRQIARELKPFLPETVQKIEAQFAGPRIKAEKPLFPRLSSQKGGQAKS